MQPYPRSPHLVWPGHLHGTGCLSARAVGTGFPTVVRRFLFGSGLRLGVGFVNPASPRCSACPPPFPVPVCGVGVRAGTGSGLCPALLGWVGWIFFFFCFVVSVAGCPCFGPCGPCPPIPSLFGWAAGSFFCFLWCVSACFGVPFPGRPLFLAWCCRFWLGGPPVSLWGSFPRCLLDGGFGRLWWCWRSVWWLCAVFAPPPPLFFFFFFWGGGCLFLPVPSLGWRTHWPAFSVVFRAAVGRCFLFRRVPAP